MRWMGPRMTSGVKRVPRARRFSAACLIALLACVQVCAAQEVSPDNIPEREIVSLQRELSKLGGERTSAVRERRACKTIVRSGDDLLEANPTAQADPARRVIGRMVEVPSGTFSMGNQLAASADQQPAHEVSVARFRIDEHEVTNGQFAEFATQTGYVSTAEQCGWSYVFDFDSEQWEKTPGTNWRHPEGPDSSITGRHDYPVVHVSWYDATAYARWAGKQLPSEAQWERAARSGLRDANYPWGSDELVDKQFQANYRQHDMKPAADGFQWAAPVKSYPPSKFGIHDISGNVWEWCADWYGEYAAEPVTDPSGRHEGSYRVLRGGSWLRSAGGCRSAYRSWLAPGHRDFYLGFRLALVPSSQGPEAQEPASGAESDSR